MCALPTQFRKKTSHALLLCGLTALSLTWQPSLAHAWGKRGHSIVCQTASYLEAKLPKGQFFKTHSFDLGYYCNVPDLIWKRPENYQQESFNHFIDMEIFSREIKADELEAAFALDRVAFNAKYPKVTDKAGRSFWRIREMLDSAHALGEKLKSTDLSSDERYKMQADWLVRLGAAGHYIGDLSQPLHVTENYDGQMNDQKGVHRWFEDDAVDELFHSDKGPGLESEVMAAAEKKWKALKPGWEKRPALEVIEELARSSNASLKELMTIDKKQGRKDIKKASAAFQKMIVDRMAEGAVATAVLWSRDLTFDFDDAKFYNFMSDPVWIAFPMPPTPQPTGL